MLVGERAIHRVMVLSFVLWIVLVDPICAFFVLLRTYMSRSRGVFFLLGSVSFYFFKLYVSVG